MSVVASLPANIREEVQRELAVVAWRNQKRRLKDGGGDENATTTATKANKKKKNTTSTTKSYRQARETKDGQVEVLCFECRREPCKKRQQTLSFAVMTSSSNTEEGQKQEVAKRASVVDVNVCAQCRIPLRQPQQQQPQLTSKRPHKIVTKLPQITRLNGYKRLAKEHHIPFTMSDTEALTIMRQSCFGCGKVNVENGNGITRLRNWDGFQEQQRKMATKGFMGPYSKINCIAACSTCNLMKGYRTVQSYVEACRTIATHRSTTQHQNYGMYPQRFRDNISKRSRSCYITKSSTHTKTHSLTNEQFNAIVALPCAYCGKEPSSTHYNGLDRLDSNDRVYHIDNVVSCCGDCNIMKYKHSVEYFIEHCTNVAEYHLTTVFDNSDDDNEEEDDDENDDKTNNEGNDNDDAATTTTDLK